METFTITVTKTDDGDWHAAVDYYGYHVISDHHLKFFAIWHLIYKMQSLLTAGLAEEEEE